MVDKKLGPTRAKVLAVIYEYGPITARGVADQLRLSPESAHHHLTGLRLDKLVHIVDFDESTQGCPALFITGAGVDAQRRNSTMTPAQKPHEKLPPNKAEQRKAAVLADIKQRNAAREAAADKNRLRAASRSSVFRMASLYA